MKNQNSYNLKLKKKEKRNQIIILVNLSNFYSQKILGNHNIYIHQSSRNGTWDNWKRLALPWKN